MTKTVLVLKYEESKIGCVPFMLGRQLTRLVLDGKVTNVSISDGNKEILITGSGVKFA